MEDHPKPPPQGPWGDAAFFTAAGCQFAASAWVLQFVFADVGPPKPDGQMSELPRLVVGVPWPLAKVMHKIMGAAIAAYETREGEIPVPKTVQEQLEHRLQSLNKS